MYKYTLIDGLNLGGYLLISAETHVRYRAIDWGIFLGDQCKSVAILEDGYYEDNKY